MIHRRLALAAVVSVTAACDQPDGRPRPATVFVGQHVTVGADEATVCSGSYDAMDRTVALLATLFDAPADTHLDVYMLSPEQMAESQACPSFACTSGTEIWSSYAPATHELVHGVHVVADGWDRVRTTPPVLGEGLAMVFGDALSDAPPAAPLASILDEGVGNPAEYERAGHFVRHLMERYGPPQTLALVRQAAGLELDAAFQSQLGASLDEVLADYDDETACARDDWRIGLLECDGDPLDWTTILGNDTVEATFALACDGDTIGPRFGRISQTRAIEVPTEGRYWLQSDHHPEHPPDAFSVRLVRCDASCEAPGTSVLHNAFLSSYAEVQLTPGRYWLQFEQDIDETDLPPIHVRLEARPP